MRVISSFVNLDPIRTFRLFVAAGADFEASVNTTNIEITLKDYNGTQLTADCCYRIQFQVRCMMRLRNVRVSASKAWTCLSQPFSSALLWPGRPVLYRSSYQRPTFQSVVVPGNVCGVGNLAMRSLQSPTTTVAWLPFIGCERRHHICII